MTKPVAFASWFKNLQKRLQEPGLSILLAVQIMTIFLVAPISATVESNSRWMVDLCVLVMAFISVFIVAAGTTTTVSAGSLVIAMIGFILAPHFTDHLGSQIILTISVLFFTGSLSWMVWHKIFNNEPVTIHKIRGAVIIYLNLALVFGYLDNLLDLIFPGSFSITAQDGDNSIGRMIYFSLVTLTTTGYGDIVPVRPLARGLANLESVVGQFYMASLIGILVGLHVSHRQTKSSDKN